MNSTSPRILQSSALALLLCFTASQSHAAIIATEDFESYTPGVIITGGTVGSDLPETTPGGTGWDNIDNGGVEDGGWNSTNDTDNNATGSTSIVQRTVTNAASGIDGQSMILEGGGGAQNIASRDFPDQTGEFYIGMDIQTDAGYDDSFFQVYVNDTRSNSPTAAMGYIVGRNDTGPGGLSLRRNGTTGDSTSAISAGEPHRVVLKFSKSGASSNYDELALWVDSFGAPAKELFGEWTAGGTGETLSILHFRINNQPDLGDTMMVDNIIVATTLAEAALVPEPSSLALLALFTTAGVLGRRSLGRSKS